MIEKDFNWILAPFTAEPIKLLARGRRTVQTSFKFLWLAQFLYFSFCQCDVVNILCVHIVEGGLCSQTYFNLTSSWFGLWLAVSLMQSTFCSKKCKLMHLKLNHDWTGKCLSNTMWNILNVDFFLFCFSFLFVYCELHISYAVVLGGGQILGKNSIYHLLNNY